MSTLFYGLIGEHLSHSFSKMIHREMGCESYEHIELPPEELEGFMKSHAFGGLNITIPYKKDVLKYCKKLTPEAEGIGCVNTVVTDKEGCLIGHNTDVDGFLFMAKNAGVELEGKKVIILGSGGASLAVTQALKKARAKSFVVISRSGENNYENLHLHYDADVIVNATPVGMYPTPDRSPVDLTPFTRCSGVLDLIYNPFRTNLLIQAEALGIPCSNGLSMLVSQALYAEEFFKGEKMDEREILRIMKIVASDRRNLVLVGMPGVGKSTVGRELSRISGKELIDTDEEIVKNAGITIPEIFEKGGEALFRRLESEEVKKAAEGFGRIIVTGGGAVKTDENYLPLKRTARIYHLEGDVNTLSRDGRPLSKGADLESMYRERLPLYERFRDSITETKKEAVVTAEKIWSDFCENSCN